MRTGRNGAPAAVMVRSRLSSPAEKRPTGRWERVEGVFDAWQVNDRWWRAGDQEIARLYFALLLEGGRRQVVFKDLLSGEWFTQNEKLSQAVWASARAPADPQVPVGYAELHCHSFHSLGEGASAPVELLTRAKELGLSALALTDHDSLSGAMEFAQTAKRVGIQAITGVEITLSTLSSSGSGKRHLTLLAETSEGYRNICRMVTRAQMDPPERNDPALDLGLLAAHTDGVICLSGCRQSEISELLLDGEYEKARATAETYARWFGPENFFLEVGQNFAKGDTQRNRLMERLGAETGLGLVATNNVHYHAGDRHHLNDALVAIKHNSTLEESWKVRRPNSHFHMKAPAEISALMADHPEAIRNTVAIAERCKFDLVTDIKSIYSFPDFAVPEGYTPDSWLRHICERAAKTKYPASEQKQKLKERLDREMALISKHGLAGFLLHYRAIVEMAHKIQVERSVIDPDTRIEDNPPVRGRGSSVALVTGYLIGASHIDPLEYDLKLERFISDELASLPDIDVDVDRQTRDELILRIHREWGDDRAVLVGTVPRYEAPGAIRDVGKALGLPELDIALLSKRLRDYILARELPDKIARIGEFKGRLESPLWKHLVRLAGELMGAPKHIGQHPGGIVFSARPLSEAVPVQRGAIDGRKVIQWDKYSIDDAEFVKIDILSMPVLSQFHDARRLIRQRHEQTLDITRIDFKDVQTYEAVHSADTVGVFQIQSPAQRQTLPRFRPSTLREMGIEVALVRPGVGANDGIRLVIQRHREAKAGLPRSWDYDHPFEEPALGDSYGVPIYQDHLSELARYVADMSTADGEKMRRAYARPDATREVPLWRERFITGALAKGVPLAAAERIVRKFHPFYQFPRSHAAAFGVTAYQAAWLKVHYPIEFYIGLINNQPMGFYDLETLKGDITRHGVNVLNPCVNRSDALAVIDQEQIRLGLTHVKGVGADVAERVIATRTRFGQFEDLADFMARTSLTKSQLEGLTMAGALDCFDGWPEKADRRAVLWEAGLRYRPFGGQFTLNIPVAQDMAELKRLTPWQEMSAEYETMQVHPRSHVMAYLRPHLPEIVVPTDRVARYPEGAFICVAGRRYRLQHPNVNAYFLGIEDEFGDCELIAWPNVFKRIEPMLRHKLVIASGRVSRRDGTLSVVLETLRPIDIDAAAVNKLPVREWR